jgi:hypothetical protein
MLLKMHAPFRSLKLSCFLFIFILGSVDAQNDSKILKAFNDYTEMPREVAYLHLNKSIYIKGEDIGFTAYVFDKKTKTKSSITTNLYVSIEDENEKIIQKKLLNLKNGITSNVFEIDTSFTSGYYTIKAYTNWMRNFDEQNYFIETIRIIDPKVEQYLETTFIKNEIDAQFLPESGHLVDQINNTVGVVLKDDKGYGLPNARGKVYDNQNNLVSEFEVNHLGIGKFPLLAQYGNQYTIKVSYLNKAYSFDLNATVELNGFTLSAVEFKNKALITLTTNKESLKYLNDKPYKLTLHNGSAINEIVVNFKDATSIIKSYNLAEIATGINIFTLFNENDQPVAERLFFNYKGLDTFKSKDVTAKTVNDSINLKFKLSNVEPGQFNTLSVSILPAETESYKKHNNILSYNLLQPYIKGHIEDAKYYFTEISDKTKFDMNNLLLTQGWSCYDWDVILKSPPILRFPFEQGITVTANVNSEKNKFNETYMVSGPNSQEPNFFKLGADQNSFIVEHVFLSEKDSIYISKLTRKGDLTTPKLYLQASPSLIPKLNETVSVLKPKNNYNSVASLNSNIASKSSINDLQQLEEVVVIAEKEKDGIRVQELSRGKFGNVKVITEDDRKNFFTFVDYIRQKGVIVAEGRSQVTFNTGRSISINSPLNMDIFIDDAYFGTSIPPRLILMNNVDHVEINKTGLGSGIGQGFKGSGGILRIYTNTKIVNKTSTGKKGKAYSVPLKFAPDKKFYVPKYQYYNDDFYKDYGTIDWKPEIKSDKDGNFSITIDKPSVPLTLFIEGIVNGKSYVYEQKTITLD